MEKGYYAKPFRLTAVNGKIVAIHNKNGKGLLLDLVSGSTLTITVVAIHNKNGKGLLLRYFLVPL